MGRRPRMEYQGAVCHVILRGFTEAIIEELGTRFNIQEIAFDCWGVG